MTPLDALCFDLRAALVTAVETLQELQGSYAVSLVLDRPQQIAVLDAIAEGREALALDREGQEAQRQHALHIRIAALAYEFAQVLHKDVFGYHRVEGQHVPTDDELREKLIELDMITQELLEASDAD